MNIAKAGQLIALALAALSAPGLSSLITVSATNLQDVRQLAPGQPIERELAGGETHLYSAPAAGGFYLRVVIVQRSGDVTLALIGADGRVVAETDSTLGVYNQKRLSFVTEAAGPYRLTVRSTAPDAARGAYQIEVAEARPATQSDHDIVTAERAYTEACRLHNKGDAESVRQAITRYGEALKGWRAAGDRRDEAWTLLLIGLAYNNLSQPKEALERMRQALPIWQELGDQHAVAQTFHNLGMAHQSAGQFELAAESFNQALALRRSLGDQNGLFWTLNNLGASYTALGEIEKAQAYLQEALALARNLGNRMMEPYVLSDLAWLYNRTGEYQAALESINQALPLYRKAGARIREARALNAQGVIYSNQGEFEISLDALNQALPIYRSTGYRAGEGFVLGNIADQYTYLNDMAQAKEHYLQALSVWQELGNKAEEALTLSRLGQITWDLGDQRKATEYYSLAQSIPLAGGDRARQIATLYALGYAYRFRLNDTPRAEALFRQGLRMSREIRHRSYEATCLAALGEICSRQGDKQQAETNFREALRIAHEIGAASLEARVSQQMASFERERGNVSEARKQIENALIKIESTRAGFRRLELRDSFFASSRKAYELYADILMSLSQNNASGQSAQEYAAEALLASERARARSLLEMLNEARVDLRQGTDPALIAQERALEEKLNAGEARRLRLLSTKSSERQVADAEREIGNLSAQLETTRANIRTRTPKYAALTRPTPLGAQEIQKLLDDDTILLEYLLADESSYLWAVTPSSLVVFKLPGSAKIWPVANRINHSLRAASIRYLSDETPQQKAKRLDEALAEYHAAGAELSRMLLAPAAEQIRGKKRLLIVSDGFLLYTPFAALPSPETESRRDVGTEGQRTIETGGQGAKENLRANVSPPLHLPAPLIVDHEVVNLPSASVLAVLRQEQPRRADSDRGLVAVLADPVFSKADQRLTEIARGKANRRNLPSEPSATASSSLSTKKVFSLERSAREAGISEFRRLRYSREEAEAIGSLASRDQILVAVDFQANRELAVSEKLGLYSIVHFATHGLLHTQRPELSGLVLSLVNEQGEERDGFLRLHEIYNLKLNAELVVLSGCETALGKQVYGEGLIGLTRGFMYAGAPRVVASLWNVDDQATATLMKLFYERMLKDGLRPAAALRAAQIAMWKTEPNAVPYRWGAFILQGDWR
jgi:CHAT domain-containing protein/Flp pilus assembly protein TadD